MSPADSLKLREELLDWSRNGGSFEERLLHGLNLRYDSSEILLSEETKERHLAAIGQLGAESLNGHAPGFLRRIATIPQRKPRRWALPIAFAAVTALVAIWILARITGQEPDPDRMVGIPPVPTEPSPDLPVKPDPKGPVVDVKPERGVTTPNQSRPPDKLQLPTDVPKGVKVGEFVAIMGEPHWKLPGADRSSPAMPAAALYAGVTLTTGDTDKLEFKFADGSSVLMDFNTTVVLPDSSGGPLRPEEIRVETGKVYCDMVAHAEPSPFAVRTDVATAEVLGTQFSLQLEESVLFGPVTTKRAKLQVRTGKVRFANSYGSVIAAAHTESLAVEGSAPTEPKRLKVLKTFHLRGGHTVTVPTKHHDERFAEPRLSLASAPHGLRADTIDGRGVLITRVERETAAQDAGLKVGDIVLSLNGRPVRHENDLIRPLVWEPPGRFAVRVRRNGATIPLSLTTRRRSDLPTISGDLRSRLNRLTQAAIWGNRKAAISALESLAKSTGHPSAYNNLGNARMLEDDLYRATLAFKEAVRLAPGIIQFRLNLSHMLRDIGNFEAAFRVLILPLQADERSLTAAMERADLLSLMDRPAEAIRTINQTVSLRPLDSRSWRVRGRILLHSGDTDAAIASLRQGVQIDPGNGHIWFDLADAFHDAKRLSDAESACRRSIEIDPKNSFYHQLLGNVLKDRRQFEPALTALQFALRERPDDRSIVMALAETLWYARKLDEALAMYDRARQADPRDAAPYRMMALLLDQLGKGDDAFRILSEGVSRANEDAQLLTNYAIGLCNQGRHDEEEGVLLKAIALGDRIAQPHSNLAEKYRVSGRVKEAEAQFLAAIECDPNNPTYRILLGKLLRNLGRHQEADRRFEEALKLDPREARTRFDIALDFQNRGRLFEAEREYRKSIEIDPKNVNSRINLGNVLFGMGRFSAAETEYRKAIELDPRDIGARANLGNLLLRTGRTAESLDELLAIVEIDPQNLNAFKGMVECYVVLGRFDDAREALNKALVIAPNDDWLAVNLGSVLLHLRQTEEAERLALTVIERSPKLPPAYELLSRIRDVKSVEAGDDALRMGLKVLPQDPMLLNALAWRLAERGAKLDEALALVKQAVLVAPKEASIIDTLGWVHFQRGELDDAERELRRALELFGIAPEAADTWYHLGMVLEKKGQKEPAIEAYRKALALDANHAKAKEALKRIGA